MSETSIEWTHPPGFKGATWNPVVGCRRVSPGCERCYAETMAGRLARMGQQRYLDVVKVDGAGQPRGRWNGTFREVPEVLDLPLRTRKPTCYFVNSMSDLFGEGVSDEYIAAVFGVMAACPQHRFLTLTKRAERLPRWFDWITITPGGMVRAAVLHEAVKRAMGYNHPRRPAINWVEWPLHNVWLGVSVEDQQRADERIPHLLATPAAVRFLSCEPLLGAVNLRNLPVPDDVSGGRPFKFDALVTHEDERFFNHHPAIDWVIVGGESGPGARPFDLAWAGSIRQQCASAGVAYFFKQAGAYPVLNDDRLHLDEQPVAWEGATEGQEIEVIVMARGRR